MNEPTFNRLLTDFYFKNKKFAKIIFKFFFDFFTSTINRISTDFFFKYKKIDEIKIFKFLNF